VSEKTNTTAATTAALGMVPGMGVIAVATDLLTELAVDAQTIADIKEILNRNITVLEEKPMDRTSESTFGQSYWGGQLGHHTSVAERHVVQAINDLVIGLNGYRESVEWVWRNFEDTDGGVSGDLTNIAGRAEATPVIRINEDKFDDASVCVDQPNLETNPSCEAPTGEN
jgi:hypothetical protein